MSFPKVFTKDPDESLDYQVDWTEQMTEDADTIASSSWTLEDGITEDTDLTTNTTVLAVVGISGGVAGGEYDVTNEIVTAGGRTYNQSFTIKVREL